MSFIKISINKAIAVTLGLLGLLFGITFIDSKVNSAQLILTAIAYLLAILYCNNFEPKLLASKLFVVEKPIRLVTFGLGISVFLFFLIYSIQILLYAIIYGETFSVNLDGYVRSYSTIFPAVLLFPFLEELLFRKSILQGINGTYSDIKSVWVSSMLFSLVHLFTETGLFSALLAGLVLGLVYIKYRNFLIVFLIHSLYNLLTSVVAPMINRELFAISLSKVFILFIPICLVSSSFILYLTKRNRN